MTASSSPLPTEAELALDYCNRHHDTHYRFIESFQSDPERQRECELLYSARVFRAGSDFQSFHKALVTDSQCPHPDAGFVKDEELVPLLALDSETNAAEPGSLAFDCFQLPHRRFGRQRWYCLAIDVVKTWGFRDTHAFYHRHVGDRIAKVWTSDHERSFLVACGIMAPHLRTRAMVVVPCDQLFRMFGNKMRREEGQPLLTTMAAIQLQQQQQQALQQQQQEQTSQVQFNVNNAITTRLQLQQLSKTPTLATLQSNQPSLQLQKTLPQPHFIHAYPLPCKGESIYNPLPDRIRQPFVTSLDASPATPTRLLSTPPASRECVLPFHSLADEIKEDTINNRRWIDVCDATSVWNAQQISERVTRERQGCWDFSSGRFDYPMKRDENENIMERNEKAMENESLFPVALLPGQFQSRFPESDAVFASLQQVSFTVHEPHSLFYLSQSQSCRQWNEILDAATLTAQYMEGAITGQGFSSHGPVMTKSLLNGQLICGMPLEESIQGAVQEKRTGEWFCGHAVRVIGERCTLHCRMKNKKYATALNRKQVISSSNQSQQQNQQQSNPCKTCSKQCLALLPDMKPLRQSVSHRHVQCKQCLNRFHFHCLPPGTWQMDADYLEKVQLHQCNRTTSHLPILPCDQWDWFCAACQSCACCSKPINDTNESLICRLCERHFHAACLSSDTANMDKDLFTCWQCLKCDACHKRAADASFTRKDLSRLDPSWKWVLVRQRPLARNEKQEQVVNEKEDNETDESESSQESEVEEENENNDNDENNDGEKSDDSRPNKGRRGRPPLKKKKQESKHRHRFLSFPDDLNQDTILRHLHPTLMSRIDQQPLFLLCPDCSLVLDEQLDFCSLCLNHEAATLLPSREGEALSGEVDWSDEASVTETPLAFPPSAALTRHSVRLKCTHCHGWVHALCDATSDSVLATMQSRPYSPYWCALCRALVQSARTLMDRLQERYSYWKKPRGRPPKQPPPPQQQQQTQELTLEQKLEKLKDQVLTLERQANQVMKGKQSLQIGGAGGIKVGYWHTKLIVLPLDSK